MFQMGGNHQLVNNYFGVVFELLYGLCLSRLPAILDPEARAMDEAQHTQQRLEVARFFNAVLGEF